MGGDMREAAYLLTYLLTYWAETWAKRLTYSLTYLLTGRRHGRSGVRGRSEDMAVDGWHRWRCGPSGHWSVEQLVWRRWQKSTTRIRPAPGARPGGAESRRATAINGVRAPAPAHGPAPQPHTMCTRHRTGHSRWCWQAVGAVIRVRHRTRHRRAAVIVF